MKKLFLIAVVLGSFLMGCNKNDEGAALYKENDLTSFDLKINLRPSIESPIYYGTKVFGDNLGTAGSDLNIVSVEVFVFDKATGVLDGFLHLQEPTESTLQTLSIKCRVGEKNIYAIANMREHYWDGIVKEEDFLKITHTLGDENIYSGVMSDFVSKKIEVGGSIVTMNLRRLVCRVVLNSLKTDFKGTPYQDMEFKNVKVYLTNVNGKVIVGTGENPTNPTILNFKGLDNSNSYSTSNLLYHSFGTLNDSGLNTIYYFYSFPNSITQESANEKFTRLVIEGTLNGNTYYYPININREGFGWNSTIDHQGMLRNKSYIYNVKILRPGSTDPDEPLSFGGFSYTLNVLDWDVVNESSIDF